MKNQIVLLGLLALCTHSQMSAASPQKVFIIKAGLTLIRME